MADREVLNGFFAKNTGCMAKNHLTFWGIKRKIVYLYGVVPQQVTCGLRV
jgi:hypothetical protein